VSLSRNLAVSDNKLEQVADGKREVILNTRRFIRPRSMRRIGALAVLMAGTLPVTSCFDSEIARRFRGAYAPGFMEGVSSAITDPANAETGLRQAWAALYDGLGAIIEPRTPATSGSN
jgi:hypothetical protein